MSNNNFNNFTFNRAPQQQQYQTTHSGTLQNARIAHRREREDAWQNEQERYESSSTSNTNNDDNISFDRARMYDPNQKVVNIGVNRLHHAPFLVPTSSEGQQQPQPQQVNEDGETIHNDDQEESNNIHLLQQNKHRALVWPAKDPNGPLAMAAIKGSAVMKEHRKRKIQTAIFRARVLNNDDDAENDDDDDDDDVKTQAGSRSQGDDHEVRTQVGNSQIKKSSNNNKNKFESSLEDDNEGADEDVIVDVMTSSSTSTGTTNTFFNDERGKIRDQRERLPAFAVRNQFIDKVRQNQVIIVQGETGSGKSTQLPQYLLEEHFATKTGIIGCTQPRRVAAIGLARRVAQEVGTQVGDLVGYAVRLEDVTSKNTKLKFMTDGVLLREAVLDADLWKYNVLVLDEAHERSVDTDVLLGVVKRILRKRRDFRLVLMSATMQIEKFSDFFDGAEIFEVSGRTFPVHHIYSPNPVEDYVEAAVLQILKVHVTAASIDQKLEEEAKQQQQQTKNSSETNNNNNNNEDDVTSVKQTQLQPTGDILVFMTGEEDVRCVCDLVRQRVAELEDEMDRKTQLDIEQCRQTGKPLPKQLKLKKLDVIPCFSTALVNKEQLDRVLDPPANPATTRKCIVATNVAETSLTIDGITVVIDCGFMKCKVFKPKMGAHPLLPFPISQAQATQRAGRAGRTREGTCFHLYTEKAFKTEMLESPVPEIKRSSIDRVCLFIKAIGIEDVEKFNFIDPPPTEIIHQSLYSLWLLGALDDEGRLTARGRQLAALPVEPAMGVVLLTSKDYRCSKECINIAAMLSVDTRALFAVPRDKEDEAMRARDQYVDLKSDHVTLHNILSRFLHEARTNGGEGAARRWAEQTFLSFSVLKTASGIRDQLEQQVGKILFANHKKRDGDRAESNNNDNNNLNDYEEQQPQQQDRFQNIIEATKFCVVSGFFPHSARRHKLGEYVTILTNVPAQLPPTSALASTTSAEYLVYNELAMTAERSFLSITTVAEPEWLVEASRGLFFIRGNRDQQQQQQQQKPVQRILNNKTEFIATTTTTIFTAAPSVPPNSSAKEKPKFVPASMRRAQQK